MQSASTRRLAHVPIAAIVIAAVALVAGIVSLGVTDNLPWQSEGAASVQQVMVNSDNPLIKGAPGHGQGDGRIGANTTTTSSRPLIKGAPAHGQGEGIVGPDVSLYVPRVQTGPSMDRADGLTPDTAPATRGGMVDNGFVIGLGEGYIGPGASTLPSIREAEASNPNDAIDRGYWGVGFTDESTTSSSVVIDQPPGTPR
jgi:hypothetical protein